jgi:DNA-binding NtrC family response regulator
MTTPLRGRLLIVDDKESLLGLLERVLAEQHDVTTVSDGARALEVVATTEFDLVLTDIRMPGADGFRVLEAVKGRWPHTEVVMMTAYASIEAAVQAIRAGAYDYLQKPMDPDDVILVVARALERRRQGAAARKASTSTSGDPSLVTSGAGSDKAEEASTDGTLPSYRQMVNTARDRASRDYLTALLRASDGNVTVAAEKAGIKRESLHRLLKRYGLRADDFREPSQS